MTAPAPALFLHCRFYQTAKQVVDPPNERVLTVDLRYKSSTSHVLKFIRDGRKSCDSSVVARKAACSRRPIDEGQKSGYGKLG
jgi:hypothetical protein